MEYDDEQAPLTPVAQFGIDVRELRTTRGMTVRGLGKAVGCSGAYVSRVENAKATPSEKFAVGCDRVFGTGTMLARQLQRALEGDDPTWFEPYINKERKAAKILSFSTLFVPGLFQTPEYARAVYRAGAPRLAASDLESRLKARMRRQEVLKREKPPELWVVLSEACLRTRVGSREVMAAQLDRLLQEAEAPNINFQLIPFDVVPASAAAFTVLIFDGAPTALHVEGPQGGRPLEAAQVVTNALAIFDRLRAEALGHDASVARIREIRKEYSL
ncbi:helix-turn-helix domain-containing protein [Streptomyces clavuligerus]|uniref:XRE family transcriptional regulator n=1 Tax=Streptomyces clavuligerus TaxID=1901 RepID=B5GNQ9_STRCL|nr:helix-turn-helix transcriptional regulator [Streptomyces clavuligerus]ANW18776.1 transcriptional regulator [Streptomyces clavuligerus]AXU13342.1 XRE family transcriptional regulator [Streptomyces clavuligerus]EDY47881.1 helix-turn-helix domain-containing protein [Streptomyces clavuligerus]EFG08545.1 XRE family transcriptional regulator [Streptomyces clavuligerus]MBY6303297.1 helix-turn-helix transcriptional regulator [Streptomyces clavuligerus]